MSRTTTSARPAASGHLAPWKRVLFGVLLTIVALLLLSIPLLRYGAVAGEEFDPHRFQRRSYHYWEIPFVHVQITPLRSQNETSDLENYLTQAKLIRPSASAKARWDLVRLRRADLVSIPQDALILCRYLDQKDEKDNYLWLQWSKDKPQLAQLLWPAVAEAARREVYVLIPELFHLAQDAATPDDLRTRLSLYLSGEYERLARLEQQLGRADGAEKWLQAASQHESELNRPGGRSGDASGDTKSPQRASDVPSP